MELWIRSQDKMKLVKVNYVYVTESSDHFTMYGETIDSAPIIGTYKTKERALEVLNEIQNILEQILDANITILPIFVYEMPQE